MNDIFIHSDLTEFPEVDRVAQREKIIDARKAINSMLKESRAKSKPDKCYYCGELCDSFCNSHTLPAFCLRNIAQEGKIFHSNSIIELPILNEKKGVNEAGVFHLICRECDSKIFQEYENPDNYKTIPSPKMLAQIDMKNNLKNISKRLTEFEIHNLMVEKIGIGEQWAQAKNSVNQQDLAEFRNSFLFARKCDSKPSSCDYYLGCHVILPYVVPIAFQGTVALISDLEGLMINNIYNPNPKYKIKNIGICIFPMKSSSIVMLYVDKHNTRYSKFFRQLNKMDLDDKLKVVNYIIFAYTEDYFISPNIAKTTLDELKPLSGKTQDMVSFIHTTICEQIKEAQKKFDYSERFSVPNLLGSEFALPEETTNE